jgi:hypothetical protein
MTRRFYVGRASDLEAVIVALDTAGYEPEPYSGRGMHGGLCVSVRVHSNVEAGELTSVVGFRPTTDNMGKGVVAYWPAISWPLEEVPT